MALVIKKIDISSFITLISKKQMGVEQMKLFIKKALSVVLSAAILFCLSIPVYALSSDVSGHWAESAIVRWAEKNVIGGFPDGSFKPDDTITRAQLANILDNTFNFVSKSNKNFSDVKGTEWFADAVAKCAQAGIINGNPDGTFVPNGTVTREQAAKMIAEAFKLKAKKADSYKAFADSASIAAYAQGHVSALYEAGYMVGVPGGNYNPKKGLSRAEALQIIDNILSDIVAEKGTYTQNVEKSLLVNSSDVTLKDIVIAGDLILAQGIGEGDVTLDGVKVNGRVVVLGGGENSIRFVNTTVSGSLFVIKEGGKVRIVASGSTAIPQVQTGSGAFFKEEGLTGTGFGTVEVLEFKPGEALVLDGDFDEVSVEVPGVTVDVTSGSIGKLTVAQAAADTSINLAAAATVTTFTANAKVEVKGTGNIQEAVINADSVKIEKAPAKVTVSKDVKEAPVVAGKVVEPGTTQTTPVPPAGSGSGSSDPGTTTNAITLSGISLIDTDGDEHDTDLSDETDGSIRISKFRATSNASTTEATIESITSPMTGTITLGVKRVFDTATADITVADIWPPYLGDRTSISIDGLRQVFGDSVTIRVTLRGTGSFASYSPVISTIEISLSDENESALPVISDWATFSYNESNNTVTAVIKEDKKDKTFAEYKDRVLQLFISMADILNEYTGNEGGVSNLSISIDGVNFYNDATNQTQKNDLKADLQDVWELDLDSATLADLNGKTLTCRYKNNATEYFINIEA